MTSRLVLLAWVAILASCNAQRGGSDVQDLASAQFDAAMSCLEDAAASCSQAPVASCIGTNELQRYIAPGACNADTGRCTYTRIVDECLHGCTNGACSGESLQPCLAGLCMSPPEPTCERETFTVYGPKGTCDSTNHCHYPSTQEHCGFPFVCTQHRCANP